MLLLNVKYSKKNKRVQEVLALVKTRSECGESLLFRFTQQINKTPNE